MFAQIDSGAQSEVASAYGDYIFFDPIPHFNQFPLALPYSNKKQYPVRFRENKRIAFRFMQNYTAMHYHDVTDELLFFSDFEQLQYRLDLAYTFSKRLSIMTSQTISYKWDGFMDPFLNWYHDLLNLPNYGREFRPENEFKFRLEDPQTGKTLWQPKPGEWAISATVFGLFYSLVHEENQQMIISIHAQMPMGDVNSSPVTGSFDISPALMYARRFGDIDVYQSFMVFIPGKNSNGFWGTADVHLKMLSGMQYSHNSHSQWLMQFQYGTPYFNRYEGHILSQYPLELVFGYRFTGKSGRYTIGFSEDLYVPAPDFTIHLSYERPF